MNLELMSELIIHVFEGKPFSHIEQGLAAGRFYCVPLLLANGEFYSLYFDAITGKFDEITKHG